MATDNRIYRRQNIDFLASVQTHSGEYEILVKDISVGGMRLQTRKDGVEFPPKKEVTVHIPFIADVVAEICWRNDKMHGLAFKNCPSVLHQFVTSILPVGDHIAESFTT